VAENFVSVLLTDKWLNCVIYMQIICVAELTYSFSSSSLIVIKSMGRSDVFLKLEIVRRAIMLGILVTTLLIFDSVFAIAISYVVSCWIDLIVVSVPLKKLIGYGFADQMKDNFKTLLSALIMGVIVYVIGLLPFNPIILLCAQVVSGIGTYIFLCFIFKIDIVQSVLGFLKKNTE
jgi:O-antigen/teichoic acid export membrane protein